MTICDLSVDFTVCFSSLKTEMHLTRHVGRFDKQCMVNQVAQLFNFTRHDNLYNRVEGKQPMNFFGRLEEIDKDSGHAKRSNAFYDVKR